MSGWLKALVATACMVVIAFVMVIFWRDHTASVRAKKEVDIEARVSICREYKTALQKRDYSTWSLDVLMRLAQPCVVEGILGKSEVPTPLR